MFDTQLVQKRCDFSIVELWSTVCSQELARMIMALMKFCQECVLELFVNIL